MIEDYGHGAVGECLLDYFAGVNAGAIDRAAEELEVFDQSVLLVEQQDREHLVGSSGHSALQEGASVFRGDSLGALEDLGRGRGVEYVACAYIESM
jgi:hypothetical protein